MPTQIHFFREQNIKAWRFFMNLKLADLCMMQYAIPYRRPYPSYIFQTPLFIAIIQGNDMSHMFRPGAVWWPQIP